MALTQEQLNYYYTQVLNNPTATQQSKTEATNYFSSQSTPLRAPSTSTAPLGSTQRTNDLLAEASKVTGIPAQTFSEPTMVSNDPNEPSQYSEQPPGELSEDGEPAQQPIKEETYEVQKGDTLSQIAQKLGVPMAAISGYKSGNPNLIFPGEVLKIARPQQTSPSSQMPVTGANGAINPEDQNNPLAPLGMDSSMGS